jgi:hypothetical protein
MARLADAADAEPERDDMGIYVLLSVVVGAHRFVLAGMNWRR